MAWWKVAAVAAGVLATGARAPGQLVVASLNPIVADLARQVGGERVTVIELMKPGMNPHAYRPSPADMRATRAARLVLAAGKGLETYLGDVEDSLEPGQSVLEVGARLPDLTIEHGDEVYACCPNHSVGAVDPHWWHDVRQAKRAARILAGEFARLDEAGASVYRERAGMYEGRLDELHRWIVKEVSRIPRRQRVLATSHAAFSYFCDAYGFRSVPIQGLSTERQATPNYLAEVIDTIRREGVRAIFPEVAANPKVIEAMVKETGVRVGGRLLAGTPGDGATYEAMMRHNVTAIVAALAPGG